MAKILQEIRSAFDAETIPVKNIALRRASGEIERLRGLLNRVDLSAVKASGVATDIVSDYIVEAAVIDDVHAEMSHGDSEK